MARVTGLEPATSGVTGRHSNRLSYTRACSRRFRAGAAWAVDKRWHPGCQAPRRRNAPSSLRPDAAGAAMPAFPLRVPREAHKSAPEGRLAQLVERFVYTEDVGGSSPSSPTISMTGE